MQFDVVIVDKSHFGNIHKDSKLSEIFGKTEPDILEEEKRLFYVAVTRAKEKLYIL